MICLVPAFLPLIFVMHQEPAAVLPSALIVFSKSYISIEINSNFGGV